MGTNAEELRKRILERQLVTVHRRRFLPDAALSEVISEQAVADVISSTNLPYHEQKDLVEFVLRDAKKIFCILVWIRAVPSISSFFRSREVDPRLPFKLEDLKNIGVSNATAREFEITQWGYTAPVFEKWARRLEPGHILPFKSDKSIPNAAGGYGAVRRVELYNVHQKLVAGGSAYAGTVILALKELKTNGRQDKAFERERSVLELIGNRRHPHIIELLGSFYTENSFNFLFPLAERDLEKLFTNERLGFWPEETFYKSIVGLASALNHIHFFTYRSKSGETLTYKIFHHDLKPANILIQQERLILADFGISELKDGNMDSATRFRGCTPSYEPPETLNPNPEGLDDPLVGQDADIRAFGCILSETATFMIHGSRGVGLYRKARQKSALPGQWDATFYASNTEVKVEVKEWLGKLKAKRSGDANMQKLLGYITEIIEPNPKSQPNAENVLEMVSDLHPRAANELASLLSRREEPMSPSPTPRVAATQYISTYPQQTPSPSPHPPPPSQPRSRGSTLPPHCMPTYLQQTPSPPQPPQQPPQPRPRAQRQARSVQALRPKPVPAPKPKPKPKPTEAITSTEARLKAQNTALSTISEKMSEREKEMKALGPKREKMGEQKYMSEHGRLADIMNRLEKQRGDELVKRDGLLVELKRVKAQTV